MTTVNYKEGLSQLEKASWLTDITQTLAETITPLEFPDALCIHQIIEVYAQKWPHSIAAVDDKECLTYQELNRQANQIAHYLQHLGVTKESPVGIYMEQSVQTIVSMLGILKSGGTYVPIDPRYPLSRIVTILEEAGISIVLTQKAMSSILAGSWYTLINVDEDRPILAQESQENPKGEVTDHNLAYIIFTSGTTGKPKGVEIEHRSLRNLISWHQQAFHLTVDDKASLFASISFDASVWELWPYLCSGASVHVVPAEAHNSLSELQNWIIDSGITISFLPTPLAEQVIMLEWPSSLPLRMLLTGGDQLHIYPPVSLPFTLVNNYGLTEDTVVATSGIVEPNVDARELPSIGKPISNVEIYILDEDMCSVPPGKTGEVYMAGIALARGYRNQPQLTKERFLPHPFSADPSARCYKTGDLAHWNSDGTLTFLGRNDQQVKIRGFRIELSEIEARLASHADVQESCVIAVPITKEENQLIAFFVARESGVVLTGELRSHLKSTLPDYMLPTKFVQLDNLPLSISGKVDRRQLARMISVQEEQEEQKAALRTDNKTEQGLAEIWSNLLQGHQFGLQDDFFKIGGHSLSVLQLIVRVRAMFGVSITVRDIFQTPTITQLATIIQGKQQAKGRR